MIIRPLAFALNTVGCTVGFQVEKQHCLSGNYVKSEFME